MKLSNYLILISVTFIAVTACSKVEYDYKELGFTDKAEMEVAFEKGYHTKQKLIEMTEQSSPAASKAEEVKPEPIESEPVANNSSFDAVSMEGEHFKRTGLNRAIQLESPQNLITLDTECKATSPQNGEGGWTWDNGGFIVNFTNKSFVFPKQEVLLQNVDKCMG